VQAWAGETRNKLDLAPWLEETEEDTSDGQAPR
jgi:hypothetical protein